jgi:C-terminal processing protease CtpA/Prc
VRFTEAGSLGLRFSPNEQGQVKVVAINPGTQATRHAALKPGLILKTVGGTSVLGMPYTQVTDVIKSNPG